MKKKTLSAILCGAMAVSLMAGCGSSASSSSAEAASSAASSASSAASESASEESTSSSAAEESSSSEAVEASSETASTSASGDSDNVVVEAVKNDGQFDGETLSILVSAGWMDNRYDATIQRFEDEYGVTVDLQTIPADQYSDVLQSDLSNGQCPDIFWIQSNPFAIESQIVDPENYCIDFTGADWQNVMPETRQSSCIYNDKLYGLQIWHNSPEYVMVYNKTLFKELGIDQVPTTYDDLKADCKTIADAGITPWFMPGADGWQHQLAFFQIGGVYTEDNPTLYDDLNNNKATFADNKKMLEVLGQFKELSDAGYFGEDWIGTDSSNMVNEFGDRTCAMAMANSSFIKQIQDETDTKDEFGLFLIPLGDNTWYPTNPAGPTMFGYKNAQDPDLVKAFFQFVCTPESLQEILDNSPAYTNLDVNVDIDQHWLPEEEEFMKTVDPDKMDVPVLQTGTKYTNDYWMQFGEDLISYCQGSMEANDVLKNMDANRAEAAETAGDPNWK
jgi:raffinose/stachyose/melibiose transport system substrate-binding protein